MQEKEPILKVEDLHYAYNGEKAALNGITLIFMKVKKLRCLALTEPESLHFF